MPVTDSEYAMVYQVNELTVIKLFCVATFSIDDAAAVRMYVLVVGCNGDCYRLLINDGLNLVNSSFIPAEVFYISDFDVVL